MEKSLFKVGSFEVLTPLRAIHIICDNLGEVDKVVYIFIFLSSILKLFLRNKVLFDCKIRPL